MELEAVSDLFTRIVSSCHQKCISTRYAEPELNKGESVCVDRSVSLPLSFRATMPRLVQSSILEPSSPDPANRSLTPPSFPLLLPLALAAASPSTLPSTRRSRSGYRPPRPAGRASACERRPASPMTTRRSRRRRDEVRPAATTSEGGEGGTGRRRERRATRQQTTYSTPQHPTLPRPRVTRFAILLLGERDRETRSSARFSARLEALVLLLLPARARGAAFGRSPSSRGSLAFLLVLLAESLSRYGGRSYGYASALPRRVSTERNR